MKKFLALVLFVGLIYTGAQAQLQKAALISVFGSRNLSESPLDTKIYEALMKDTTFNLKPIVNKFDVVVREKFLPQFPFPFVAKDEVVKAQGYEDLRQLTKWGKDNIFTTPADGYIPIAAYGVVDDGDAIKKSFELIPGVDGVMITYIDFRVSESIGFGPLAQKKIYAYVNLKIFNKDGKRIFKLKERAVSDKGVLAVGGIITDTKKLMPMIESASKNLLEDMNEKLPKSLAKMAKQMDKYNKD